MRVIDLRSERVLRWIAAILALTLCLQAVTLWKAPHTVRATASWAHYAADLSALQGLASQIVIAKVERTESAPDLQVAVAGEPGNVDRVPIEIVMLNVERTIKGTKSDGKELRLFHTAFTRAGVAPAPMLGAEGRRRPPPSPDAGVQRTTILEDDPEYLPGERYLLFLTPGPTIADQPTLAVVAPEGRYIIDSNDVLREETTRGAGPELDGRKADDIFPTPPPASHRTSPATAIGIALLAATLLSGNRSKSGNNTAPSSTTTSQSNRQTTSTNTTTHQTEGTTSRASTPNSSTPSSSTAAAASTRTSSSTTANAASPLITAITESAATAPSGNPSSTTNVAAGQPVALRWQPVPDASATSVASGYHVVVNRYRAGTTQPDQTLDVPNYRAAEFIVPASFVRSGDLYRWSVVLTLISGEERAVAVGSFTAR